MQKNVESTFRRNAAAIILWDAIWGLGAPACLVPAVVPAYLLMLGAPKTLVQFTTVLFFVSSILQLFSARIVYGKNRKYKILIIWCLYGSGWLIYGIAAYWGFHRFGNHVWIFFFVFICFLLAVTMNIGAPTYSELILQNTPLKKRGRLGSARNICFGLFGMLGSLLVWAMMKSRPEPSNFHFSFIMGSSILIISCFALFFFKDNIQTSSSNVFSSRGFVKTYRHLLGNFNFRILLIFYGFLVAGLSLGPLFIGYGKDVLSIPMKDISHFTAVYFLGPIIFGGLLPPLADKYGFRIVAILCAFILLVAFLLPVFMEGSKYALLAAYGLYAGCYFLSVMLLANLGAELVADVRPALLIAVGNTFVVPISLGMGLVGGLLADLLQKTGYIAIFIMGATVCFCALVGFATILREPRTGQEIYIRIRRT